MWQEIVIPPLSAAAEQTCRLFLNKISKDIFGETGQDPCGTQKPSLNHCLDIFFPPSQFNRKSSAGHMFKMLLYQRLK